MKFISKLLFILSVFNVQFYSRADRSLMNLQLNFFNSYSMKGEHNSSGSYSSAIITDIVVKIIKQCTLDTPTILFHEDSLYNTVKTLMTWKPINVILHNEFYVKREDFRYNNVHPFDRIDMFILIVTNSKQFQKALNLLIWIKSWNVGIPTFIVNQEDKMCASAMNHFDITWELNLSAPYFICINSGNNVMIYTHSPYASQAPYSWKIAEEFPKLNGNVFKRIYNEENICNNLYFDRTRNLDGNSINVVKIDEKTVIPNGAMEYYEKFENAIKSSLNTTFNNRNKIVLNPSKFVKLLTNKEIDLVFRITQFPSDDKLRITYPVMYSKDYILTHPKGHFKPIEIIFTFHNLLTIILTIVSLLIVKVISVIGKQLRNDYVSKKQIKSNCQNVSIVILEDFISLKTKFIFFIIFFQFLMIYGFFYGDLTKYFIRPQLKKNIEKFEDFKVNTHSHIFTHLAGTQRIEDVVEDDKHVVNQYESCINNIINETLAACIDDYTIALDASFTYNLYVSKYSVDSIKPFYFIMRRDWLLYQRVDEIFMMLEQAGISEVWYNKLISIARRRKNYIDEYSDKLKFNYKSININTLMIAFVALAVGLICSMFSLILEIIAENRNRKITVFEIDELILDETEDINGIPYEVEKLFLKR